MESTSVVLTVMGEDQPGLVEALAGTIAGHDGNWLESRMAHLAGKFAGILRVTVPESRVEALVRALAQLEARGLQVRAESGVVTERSAEPVELELVGADHPGIVRDVSMALARSGVNVEALETGCTSAPVSGDLLFRARARLHLPAGVTVERLRTTLEAVADDLMVDIMLGSRSDHGS